MKLSPRTRYLYSKCLPLRVRLLIERALFPAYPREYDEYGYIFIHIPKTAGKSIISKLHDRGATHLAYSDYEKILGHKIRDYFVFTVLRDPVDRISSAFYYLRSGGNQSREDKKFSARWLQNTNIDEFIAGSLTNSEVQQSLFFRSQASFLKSLNGETAPVTILNFESLDKDFAAIADRLGVSADLPTLNSANRANQQLSEKSIKIIKTLYKEDYALRESYQTIKH